MSNLYAISFFATICLQVIRRISSVSLQFLSHVISQENARTHESRFYNVGHYWVFWNSRLGLRFTNRPLTHFYRSLLVYSVNFVGSIPTQFVRILVRLHACAQWHRYPICPFISCPTNSGQFVQDFGPLMMIWGIVSIQTFQLSFATVHLLSRCVCARVCAVPNARLLQAARKQIATKALGHDLHLYGDIRLSLGSDTPIQP